MKRPTLRAFCFALVFVTVFSLFACKKSPPEHTSDSADITSAGDTEPIGAATDSPLPATAPKDERTSVHVPILMYHHFSDSPNNSMVLSPETFKKHLEFIKENGYVTVSFDELYEYVKNGTQLPEKPVCITFDDGYYSNYSIAFPILRELEMKATIFPIGWCIGKSVYKETGIAIYPHFGFDEMQEMLDSGIISIGSHTYDMHQSRLYETAAARPNVLPLENESRENHIAALTADLEKYSVLFRSETGKEFTVLAYPEGAYDSTSEEVIHAFGIPITLSTSSAGHNYVVKGVPESLHALCRLNMTEQTSEDELLCWLEGRD